MKILNEFKHDHEGNDCWLADYVVLIELCPNLYTVVHVDTVTGSWTGNPKSSESVVFDDYQKAASYMDKLVRSIRRY